jgi:putative PIN family toxin of toxin-antitoxin system
MRVVIDTNVWLSALLWGGQPNLIIKLIEKQQIQAISSENILIELTDILQKSKLQKRLSQLKLSAEEVVIVAKRLMTLVVIEEIIIPELRDPKDQMVLATAIAGDVQVVISGDKDLLVLNPYRNISILLPQDFLSHYF